MTLYFLNCLFYEQHIPVFVFESTRHFLALTECWPSLKNTCYQVEDIYFPIIFKADTGIVMWTAFSFSDTQPYYYLLPFLLENPLLLRGLFMPLALNTFLTSSLAFTGFFLNSLPLLMPSGPGSQSPHHTFPDRIFK